MTFHEAMDFIKKRFPDYLENAKKRGQFVCPLCGHGKHGDGLSVVPVGKGGDGVKLHCFGCGFHGDLIDLAGRERGMDFWDSFMYLCDRYNIKPVRNNSTPVQSSKTPELTDPAAAAYLSSRGISIETAKKYGLLYDPAWVSPTALENLRAQGKTWTPPPSPRIIIPTSEGGYTARATDPATPPRLRKMKEGPAGLFNPEALYCPEGRPVFIVEGEFDALALLEVGSHAVALGSVSNRGKLVSLLEAKKPTGPLILSLDNDKAGKDASLLLSEALQGLSVPFIVSDIAHGHKDASEALTAQKTAFAQRVAQAETDALSNPDSVASYMDTSLEDELQSFRQGAFRRTGFDVLDDEAGGIYPGLYVLGAISSLGKTTFLHQMADQMASHGQHVLYFSLEQSRLELVSKSIARNAAQRAGRAVVSSIGIRTGALSKNVSEGLSEAFNDYRRAVGDRLSLIEGGFECTTGYIRGYVERYCARFRVKPVVIVDYLQILQGDEASRSGARERTDESVIALKRLSRDLDVPVFVVSSVNRANYLAPIDFESFKESGGIEYTADVVWGLQLEVLSDEIFNKEGKLKDKREMIRRAKMMEPRRVELVCLKNRYGRSSYKVSFEYFAGCDWFRDVIPPQDAVRR